MVVRSTGTAFGAPFAMTSEARPRSRSPLPRVILPTRRALERNGSTASAASASAASATSAISVAPTVLDSVSDVSLEFFSVPDQYNPDGRMNGSMMGPMADDERPQPRTPRRVWSVPDVLARPSGTSAMVAGATSMAAGMSAGMAFGQGFRNVLTAHAGAEHGPISFASCIRHAEFTGDICAYCRRFLDCVEHFFYIGITENPEVRFADHQFVSNWEQMHVLLEAETSAITGMYENDLLVNHYLRTPRCLNVGRGNEHASSGSPHFLYVVVSEATPLIRRRGRMP